MYFTKQINGNIWDSVIHTGETFFSKLEATHLEN